jgi:hypothetical protein
MKASFQRARNKKPCTFVQGFIFVARVVEISNFDLIMDLGDIVDYVINMNNSAFDANLE